VGKAPNVLARLLDLQQALGAIGIKLNLAKCRLWGPGIQTADQDLPTFPLGLAPDHPGLSIPVIPFGGATGITTLGVPVVHPKECPAGASQRHQNARPSGVRQWSRQICSFNAYNYTSKAK